ncbi:MAG: hypothetical protein HY288_03490 [Planctomycetia bacterium]|nr:hypothetical protein [Planctomycetia bacterium]
MFQHEKSFREEAVQIMVNVLVVRLRFLTVFAEHFAHRTIVAQVAKSTGAALPRRVVRDGTKKWELRIADYRNGKGLAGGGSSRLAQSGVNSGICRTIKNHAWINNLRFFVEKQI